MRTRDFTTKQVGTKVTEGEIKTCPYCDKAALLETVDGKDFYLHTETVGFDNNGNSVIDWQMCPTLESQPSSVY
jgi:hypothetical protein